MCARRVLRHTAYCCCTCPSVSPVSVFPLSVLVTGPLGVNRVMVQVHEASAGPPSAGMHQRASCTQIVLSVISVLHAVAVAPGTSLWHHCCDCFYWAGGCSKQLAVPRKVQPTACLAGVCVRTGSIVCPRGMQHARLRFVLDVEICRYLFGDGHGLMLCARSCWRHFQLFATALFGAWYACAYVGGSQV